jgi:hypothetical protein
MLKHFQRGITHHSKKVERHFMYMGGQLENMLQFCCSDDPDMEKAMQDYMTVSQILLNFNGSVGSPIGESTAMNQIGQLLTETGFGSAALGLGLAGKGGMGGTSALFKGFGNAVAGVGIGVDLVSAGINASKGNYDAAAEDAMWAGAGGVGLIVPPAGVVVGLMAMTRAYYQYEANSVNQKMCSSSKSDYWEESKQTKRHITEVRMNIKSYESALKLPH